MSSVSLLVEELLNEYEDYKHNGYIRRVMEGKGQKLIAELEDDIEDARSRREMRLIIRQIENNLDDCGYGEELRDVESFSNHVHAGTAIGGVLGSTTGNDNDVAAGALLGFGAGLLAYHFNSKEQSLIEKHITELNRLLIAAQRKERKLKN